MNATRARHDIWEDYDPVQVIAVVRKSSKLPSNPDTHKLDEIIADIRAQRDQTPRHDPGFPT